MTTITLPFAVLKAACSFTSDDETNPYLKGVFLEYTEKTNTMLAVATDGHRLAVLNPVGLDDETLFYKSGGFFANFILPSAAIKSVKPPKAKKNETSWACLDTDAGTLSVLNLAIGKPDELAEIIKKEGVTVKYAPIYAAYPEWRRVIPPVATEATPTTLNAEYMASFKAITEGGRYGALTIHTSNGTAPAIIRSRTETFDAFALLMPMLGRPPHEKKAKPAWLGLAPAQQEQPDAETVAA